MFMTPHDFRTVRAALVEGNSQLRSDMRLALLEKGLREPATCHNAESFFSAMNGEMVDLVVCDSSAFGDDFAVAMQRIRRHAVGANPFVVVIATVADASAGQVQSALRGGVDDLVRKPSPARRVVERIDQLVKDRKPFIATRNYVGPTRSNAVGTEEDGELLNVPNTLRSKVVDKVPEAKLRRAIAQKAVTLKERVAEHPLAGIERMVRRALARSGAADEDLKRNFAELSAISQEMSGHYRGGDSEHIANLAMALSKLADRIARQETEARPKVDFDLLDQLGGAVRGSMAGQGGAKTLVDEIAATIDRYVEAGAPAKTYH